ncbi:hypothetical protein [Nocardioides taihuensis]|uniref:DUF4440 domain-containing protein n=1 Tax=Nocardioides taihuensis TaxID=1835606 RepID=A0ABW0BLE2_9ACTN
MSEDDSWAEALCRAVRDRADRSHVEMFEVARSHLHDPDFEDRVCEHPAAEPSLVDQWETFSGDNRGSPASYFDGTIVGRYDGGRRDVVVHRYRVTAAADFIHRRAVEILTGGRLVRP